VNLAAGAWRFCERPSLYEERFALVLD